MTDPISDMLTRIRNAISDKKSEAVLPYSNFKFRLAELLKENGRIENVEKVGEGSKQMMKITLKYQNDTGEPLIFGLKRVSKPGQRIYSKGHEVPRVRISTSGVTIVSTSKGLMTDDEARKQNVGGEVICQIW